MQSCLNLHIFIAPFAKNEKNRRIEIIGCESNWLYLSASDCRGAGDGVVAEMMPHPPRLSV